MREAVRGRDREAERVFAAHAWPLIKPIVGGGDYVRTEFGGEYDTVHGIDGWIHQPSGTSHIAHRVQWDKNYRTYTFRLDLHNGALTEFEKRVQQIAQGLLYPRWTCHAYFSKIGGRLLGVGIAETRPIIQAIQAGFGFIETVFEDGQAPVDFYVVSWDHVWPNAAEFGFNGRRLR